MKVQGMVNPGSFTVEQIPGTKRSLVRLFQNVTPVETEEFTGFEYDEYHVEVETGMASSRTYRTTMTSSCKKAKTTRLTGATARCIGHRWTPTP